jgi:hypothetical protein
VAECCERGYEPWSSREFLDSLRNCWLFKKGSASHSYLASSTEEINTLNTKCGVIIFLYKNPRNDFHRLVHLVITIYRNRSFILRVVEIL